MDKFTVEETIGIYRDAFDCELIRTYKSENMDINILRIDSGSYYSFEIILSKNDSVETVISTDDESCYFMDNEDIRNLKEDIGSLKG